MLEGSTLLRLYRDEFAALRRDFDRLNVPARRRAALRTHLSDVETVLTKIEAHYAAAITDGSVEDMLYSAYIGDLIQLARNRPAQLEAGADIPQILQTLRIKHDETMASPTDHLLLRASQDGDAGQVEEVLKSEADVNF